MKRSRCNEANAAALDEAARAVFREVGNELHGTNGHMVDDLANKAFTVFYGKMEYFGCTELNEVKFVKNLWDGRATELEKLTGLDHRKIQESLRVQQIRARSVIAAVVSDPRKSKSVEEALYACSSIVSAWVMDRAVVGSCAVSLEKKFEFTHGGETYNLIGADLTNLSWLGAITGRYTLAGGGVYLFSIHSTKP